MTIEEQLGKFYEDFTTERLLNIIDNPREYSPEAVDAAISTIEGRHDIPSSKLSLLNREWQRKEAYRVRMSIRAKLKEDPSSDLAAIHPSLNYQWLTHKDVKEIYNQEARLGAL